MSVLPRPPPVTIASGGTFDGHKDIHSEAGITVALSSANGDVGSVGQSILAAAGTTLSSNAANGNSYIQQTGNVALAASSVQGTFNSGFYGRSYGRWKNCGQCSQPDINDINQQQHN